VQYRESDWAFVNRILEDEGIFYYFVDDGDACTLVFADDAPGCPEIAEGPELPLVAVRAVADGDVLLALTMARRLGVNAAALRDYNFSQPRMDLGVEVDDGEATRELFDYPGGYEAGDRGAKIVRARLDAE